MDSPCGGDGEVDACGDEADGSGVPEAVRCHMFRPKRWHRFHGRHDVSQELEP
jgi:hypothetical protein